MRQAIIPAIEKSEQRMRTPRQADRASTCPRPGTTREATPAAHGGTRAGRSSDPLIDAITLLFHCSARVRPRGLLAVDFLELRVGHATDVVPGTSPDQPAFPQADDPTGVTLD